MHKLRITTIAGTYDEKLPSLRHTDSGEEERFICATTAISTSRVLETGWAADECEGWERVPA